MNQIPSLLEFDLPQSAYSPEKIESRQYSPSQVLKQKDLNKHSLITSKKQSIENGKICDTSKLQSSIVMFDVREADAFKNS